MVQPGLVRVEGVVGNGARPLAVHQVQGVATEGVGGPEVVEGLRELALAFGPPGQVLVPGLLGVERPRLRPRHVIHCAQRFELAVGILVFWKTLVQHTIQT